MFRLVAKSLRSVTLAQNFQKTPTAVSVPLVRCMSQKVVESDDDFDARYVAYFQRPEIDTWEIRKGMNDLHGMDLVPEPKIIIAALHACRRLNDYALAVRYVESLKDKCGNRVSEIFPYIMQEIKPTMDELGISTLEEMGYDKPELNLEDVADMH